MSMVLKKNNGTIKHIRHTTTNGFKTPTKKFATWLQNSDLPNDIIACFMQSVPVKDITNNTCILSSEAGITCFNDELPEFLEQKLFIIGSTTNGDYLVIDFADNQRKVLYISYKDLYKNDEYRIISAEVANDFKEFIVNFNAGKIFPTSYKEALYKAK